MTERFTRDDSFMFSSIKDNGKPLKVSEVVDLLNKLYEENEQLKEEIEPLKQKEEVLNKIWRTYLENHEFLSLFSGG